MNCGGFLARCPALASLTQNNFLFTLLEWQEWLNWLRYHLTYKYHLGSNDIIIVSVTTFIEGAVIFTLALLLSRTTSALLQKRIAKRAYLDPGIQYTLGR